MKVIKFKVDVTRTKDQSPISPSSLEGRDCIYCANSDAAPTFMELELERLIGSQWRRWYSLALTAIGEPFDI